MQKAEIDWLQWRLTGIGASDAPSIMGKSEFKTKRQLYFEKFNKIVDTEQERTFAQDKGHRFEAQARAWWEFETEKTWTSIRFTDSEHSFLIATFDGFNNENQEGWECKWLGKELFLKLKDEKLSLWDRIPEKYIDQIMHQFMVSKVKKMYLTGVCDSMEKRVEGVKQEKHLYTLTIDWNEEIETYINNVLKPAELEFWDAVQKGIEPEEYFEVKDKEVGALIVELECNKRQLKKTTNTEKELMDFFLHKEINAAKFNGIRVKLSDKKEVNYKNALYGFLNWCSKIKSHALSLPVEIQKDSVYNSFMTLNSEQPNFENFLTPVSDIFTIDATEMVVSTPKPEKKPRKKAVKDENKEDADGNHNDSDSHGIGNEDEKAPEVPMTIDEETFSNAVDSLKSGQVIPIDGGYKVPEEYQKEIDKLDNYQSSIPASIKKPSAKLAKLKTIKTKPATKVNGNVASKGKKRK